MVRPADEELEDYVWGRSPEQVYLERIAHCDELTSANILQRVSEIDESLNRQLRKGVEENLSRLLEQTTALEALESTQSNVHSVMNDVHETCDRFAKLLDSLLRDYRDLTTMLEHVMMEKNLTADALRCDDLLDSLERRNEIVKRSEIVSEVKGMIADNPDLLSVIWLRDTLITNVKAVENEVRRSAADNLRRGLESLNASLIASATRALANLDVLEAELEVQLSSSAAEVDKRLVELSSTSENDIRLVQQCVNHIHSQLEQCTLLGNNYLQQFIEKLVRIIRARIPLDAPFALRFVKQMSKVLNGFSSGVGPLLQALRPLKTSILSQSLARLYRIVEEHDFTNQDTLLIDSLIPTIEEEVRRLEWDVELKEETQKNVNKCLSMVAKRLESEIKLDAENLLIGDRLRSDQIKHYRLLEIANSLVNKWPAQAEPLLLFERECVSTIMDSIRANIFAIVLSMHRETIGDKQISPYMQELIRFISLMERHFSLFYSTIQSTYSLPSLADYVFQLFFLNSTLLRPLNHNVRLQLKADLESLLKVVNTKLSHSTKYTDATQLLLVFDAEESYEKLMSIGLPAWIFVHMLISDSPSSLLSPYASVNWTIEEYVKWCCDHSDEEIMSFLSGLMTSYTTSVVSQHETEFVPHYPKIMDLINKATSLRNIPTS